MAKATMWLTAGSIIATFNVGKAIDASGAVIEPTGEYVEGMARCVLYAFIHNLHA